MAATTGFPMTVWSRSMRANNRWPWPSASLADAGSWNACSQRMSAPARKLSRLAEPMTSALIDGSRSTSATTVARSPASSGLTVLRGSPARSSRATATPSSTVRWTWVRARSVAVTAQRSSTRAAPRPPAAHWVTNARPEPLRASSLAMVSAWRAPVAAKGWPNETDPP